MVSKGFKNTLALHWGPSGQWAVNQKVVQSHRRSSMCLTLGNRSAWNDKCLTRCKWWKEWTPWTCWQQPLDSNSPLIPTSRWFQHLGDSNSPVITTSRWFQQPMIRTAQWFQQPISSNVPVIPSLASSTNSPVRLILSPQVVHTPFFNGVSSCVYTKCLSTGCYTGTASCSRSPVILHQQPVSIRDTNNC